VIEAIQIGNVLKVRVAKHAPATGLFLWVPVRPAGLLEKSLLEGLISIDRSCWLLTWGMAPMTRGRPRRACCAARWPACLNGHGDRGG
jgi:hypothetical protein